MPCKDRRALRWTIEAVVSIGNAWRQLKSDISTIRPIRIHNDTFQDIRAIAMSVFLDMVCLIDGFLHPILIFDALLTVHFALEVVPTCQPVRNLNGLTSFG